MRTLWVLSLQKAAINPCGPHPFSLRQQLGPWNHTCGVWQLCQASQELARLDQNNQWVIWKSPSGGSRFKQTFKATATRQAQFLGTHLAHIRPLSKDRVQVDSVIRLVPSWFLSAISPSRNPEPPRLEYWMHASQLWGRGTDSLMVVSDGLMKDELLTFGSVFREGSLNFEMAGIIPSHPQEVSSYRSELGGLL